MWGGKQNQTPLARRVEKQTNHSLRSKPIILRIPPESKHFSDERGLPFYYVKIGFLEYLQISGEIWYPNGPISYRKKRTL